MEVRKKRPRGLPVEHRGQAELREGVRVAPLAVGADHIGADPDRGELLGAGAGGDHQLEPAREQLAWEKQVLSATQGVQARRKAIRICYINGMEVRKKRPRGVQEEAQGVQVSPLNPLSVAPWRRPLICRQFPSCSCCRSSGTTASMLSETYRRGTR